MLKTDLNLSLLCLLLRCRLSVRSKLLGVAARLQPSPLSHVPFILATVEGAVFSRLTLLSHSSVPWLSTLFRLPVPLSRFPCPYTFTPVSFKAACSHGSGFFASGCISCRVELWKSALHLSRSSRCVFCTCHRVP